MSQAGRSRRAVLQTGFRVAAGAGLLGFSDFAAAGAPTSERVLVGVYLLGGNDGNNLVTPLDQYETYAAGRGSLALPATSLLKASGDGLSQIGFHPALARMRDLFDAEALAIAANIGPEAMVSTHSDSLDFAYFSTGYITSKWAASIAGATSLHPNGNVVTGFKGPTGPSALTLAGRGAAGLQSRLFENAANPKLEFARPFPSSGLGTQLLQAARMIRSGLGGIGFPHFFAVQSGYDTHADQLNQQEALFSELNAAVYAFHMAMVEMGITRQVTLYTDSEFGRAFAPNDTGGSEHGWGNHQIILGGSVGGGHVYGSFPNLTLGSSSDTSRAGVWRPACSKAQYAATLAAWTGVAQSEILRVFAGLGGLSTPGFHFMN